MVVELHMHQQGSEEGEGIEEEEYKHDFYLGLLVEQQEQGHWQQEEELEAVEHHPQELKSVVKQPVFEGVARVVKLHMHQQGSEEGDGTDVEYDHDQDLDLLVEQVEQEVHVLDHDHDLDLLVEQVEPNFEELQSGIEADAGIDAH